MLYRFEEFTLDPLRRELRRGSDLLSVEPMVVDLLLVLLAHRSRVVSKEELVREVWNGCAISDSTISSRMAALRRALDDCGREQRLIRTHSRRGYRFVGEAREEDAEPGEDPGRSPTRVGLLRRLPILAVLPFATGRSDPLEEAAVNGIAEDMITDLSQLRWLSVRSRGASFAARGWDLDPRLAGERLGADYLVEGSLRDLGGRMRVTARLVRAADGAALWSGRLDSETGEGLDRLTERLVSGLTTQLELERIDAAARKPLEQCRAIDLYLRGMGQLYRWDRQGLSRAFDHFSRAAETEPDLAAAHAMVAYCFVQKKSNGWIDHAAGDPARCERSARRAAELAADDPVALARAAHAVASVAGDIDSGAVFLDRALALDPNAALAWYVSGWLRLFLGEPEVAAEHLQRATQLGVLDRNLFKVQAAQAYACFFTGRYDEGAALAERVMHARPTYQTAIRGAAANHALAGRLDRARKLVARSSALDPALSMQRLNSLIPFRKHDHLGRWMEALHRGGLSD